MKNYSLTITSNFLNHYSLALSNEMRKYFTDFHFVVNEKLPEERKNMGFADLNDLDFVVKEWEDPKKVEELFLNSDYVITDYHYNKYLKKRLKLGKPVAYDTERLFKTNNIVGTALRYIKYWFEYHADKKSPLLCISGYAGPDYNDIGLFKNRTYKWGYFPEPIKYNIEDLLSKKKKNSMIWAGRLIEWKHPDDAIKIAKRLKDVGYDFELNIIGNGEMEDELKKMVQEYKINDKVHLLGSMSPDKVREYMEESEIYLFTSDRGEGWGVVLNEAMNSGCACVASYSAGSSPFLIKENENGVIYYNEDVDELFSKTKYLLDNETTKIEIQKNAYNTIVDEWNPNTASKKLYEFVDKLYTNGKYEYFEDGILSKTN